MKKSIFLIVVLFVISIFVNRVYGYNVENNIVYFENYNDFYDYIGKKNITLDKEIDFDAINTRRNIILNSEEFNNYSSTYSYQFYLDNKIYLFNKKPTINIQINSSSTLATITFMLELESTNANYVILSANSSGVVSASEKSVGATTKFTLHVFTGFGTNKQFYSKENLDFYIRGINFDLYYTGTEETIVEKNPSIQLLCEYNSDFSQATLTAFILNAKGGEKLYYSGDIIFNSGLNSGSSEGQHSGAGSSFGEEVDSLFQLYNTPVSFTTNRVVTFKLCDSNNNFICQSSYNITQIQNFNGVSFDVSFDTSNASYLIFTPTISALDNSYYSIYCKINTDTSDLLVTRNGNRFSDYSDSNYTLLSNNETITLKYTGSFSANVNIDFEIRNKNNGAVVLTRTYSYKISKSSDSTLNDIVENGASTGGGLGSGFSSLNENSSINDIIETSKESFNTFSSIFGLLPGFIWAFLATILIVLIVLRVLGR